MSSPYSKLEKYLIQALRDIAAEEPMDDSPEELSGCLAEVQKIAREAVRKAVHG